MTDDLLAATRMVLRNCSSYFHVDGECEDTVGHRALRAAVELVERAERAHRVLPR